MRAKYVFCYLDFRSYLKANDPTLFHFLLKVLLPLKFIVKSTQSTYRLPKRMLKKPTRLEYGQSKTTLFAKQAVTWKPTMRWRQGGYRIRIGRNKTRSFSYSRGVRQGCILSPCLFNLYVKNTPYLFGNTLTFQTLGTSVDTTLTRSALNGQQYLRIDRFAR